MKKSGRSLESANNAPGDHPALSELRTQLEEFDAPRLVDLLLHLASDGVELHDRIQTLSGPPSERAKVRTKLRKRLDRIKNVDDYYTYCEAPSYVAQIESWIEDVAHAFLPGDARSACDLLEEFIRADQQIIESVDDSDGAAGDTFRRACGLWHVAAALDPSDEDWVIRLHSLYGTNDYGVRDALLDHAGPHLPEPELRRLLRLFRDQAERYHGNEFRCERGTALTAMGQIAGTLRDAGLYEDVVKMRSPEPNALQAISIAKRYLAFGPVEKAIEWLEMHERDERSDRERLELLAEAYGQAGHREKVMTTRRVISEQSMSRAALDELLRVLPPAERAAARRSAIERATAGGKPVPATRLLFHLGEGERAAQVILRDRGELESAFYGDLLELAQDFSKVGESLAEIVCYRILLVQILDQGRSKAYHHAADYARHLEAADRTVSDYGDLTTHTAFMEEMRATHGRKYSFWRRLEP